MREVGGNTVFPHCTQCCDRTADGVMDTLESLGWDDYWNGMLHAALYAQSDQPQQTLGPRYTPARVLSVDKTSVVICGNGIETRIPLRYRKMTRTTNPGLRWSETGWWFVPITMASTYRAYCAGAAIWNAPALNNTALPNRSRLTLMPSASLNPCSLQPPSVTLSDSRPLRIGQGFLPC